LLAKRNALLKACKGSIKHYNKKIIKIKSKYSSKIITNPFQVVWISTKLINLRTKNNWRQLHYKKLLGIEMLKLRMVGYILGGNWDQNTDLFVNTTNSLESFKQRFIEGKSWEETKYFEEFKKRNVYHGCNDWKSFKKKHLLRWEKIYFDIKENGYKTQKELGNKPESEIEVCISRNGQVIQVHGNHRLAIAKILNLKEVPVIVNIWHKKYFDWVKMNTDIDEIIPKTAIQPILDGRAETII